MAGQRTCQRRSSRAGPGKMQEPPKSIEEFLKFQNWDYWPREIHFRDDDKWSCTLKKIKEDSSFVSIYTHLWENVPRIFEALLIMESKLKEYSLILQNHTSEIFKWKSMISETSSYRKLERYGEFLKKYHKKKKIMERVFKIWKTHFLSEASIALLHDSFWWWFLHKFRPDRENQDCLFDRISESYVTLFMSIPLSRKDAFFQIYPDCLAQAIYATFHEAFPESSYLFNDEFKEDLGNNIFLWCSGLKPQKGFWIHWKLKELSTTTIHGSKKAPAKSVKERIADSQEHISTSIDFNIIKILNNPRAYTLPISKEESRLSRLATKSHYSSTGPEFNRVLFNFGGQSPLILYYLKMHELAGISKAPKKTKIKLTKIFQEPLPAPTYRDVIKEAKRQFARNQKDFRMEKLRINEEIKLLKQQQERIDKELDRLQAKATKKPHEVKQDFEKFLHKLRSEAEIERECVASLSSSSSSSPSSTDNYNFEEEEY
ncbi:protein FAM227B isoform X5 [Homo sapiens]|uniref:protein FAM227B isoform X5 n=2 Tax=Homo sapiens TaxID=9606 RepID=UPI0003EB02F3|nr:protein FAM227B isoform X5 [Homo sapiens]XP_047288178.1 protein FAM227B isoform X5 [Homo sapiens]XP_054233424.1 protein FAM227B isoform X5 [Homo sapiens]XP_054233425.1 protein FAM227B isoform X5 [Homo sapiens]|eukprot:XP_006720489.1 protein FAM227B isoform X5 [Homo sapiens]